MRSGIVALAFIWFACTTVSKEGGSQTSTSTAETTATQKANEKNTSSPASNEPIAKIKFDKYEHDFGKIREGEKASYRFRVTNPGSVPLRITDVKPSCGCTSPGWTKEPIPPGGEGYVEVVFDSQARSGEQMKTITVFANTDPPSHILRFRGIVVPQKQSEK
ncbi:MAG: DUF1573 domain-containing protein [Bacteroidia bacterium]|nr:DUF1573 domain-containing protein [Bacteroidia bacterium]